MSTLALPTWPGHELEISIMLKIRSDIAMWDHFTLIVNSLRYQTMIKTSSGKFGIAPYTAEAGDKVALLADMKCPAIIRPQGDIFELVAFAYIHDYMDGQGGPTSEDALEDLVFL
jgi:hypothetical protein